MMKVHEHKPETWGRVLNRSVGCEVGSDQLTDQVPSTLSPLRNNRDRPEPHLTYFLVGMGSVVLTLGGFLLLKGI